MILLAMIFDCHAYVTNIDCHLKICYKHRDLNGSFWDPLMKTQKLC